MPNAICKPLLELIDQDGSVDYSLEACLPPKAEKGREDAGVFYRDVSKCLASHCGRGPLRPRDLSELIVNCGGVVPHSNDGYCPCLTVGPASTLAWQCGMDTGYGN